MTGLPQVIVVHRRRFDFEARKCERALEKDGIPYSRYRGSDSEGRIDAARDKYGAEDREG